MDRVRFTKTSADTTCFDKANSIFVSTWMCWPGGIGEVESVDHGRSRDPEVLAGDEGKYSVSRPTIGRIPCLLDNVQDAQGFLAHHPLFSFLIDMDVDQNIFSVQSASPAKANHRRM